ncbi:DUF2500 domain-containing protein [Brevibacillus brevis]
MGDSVIKWVIFLVVFVGGGISTIVLTTLVIRYFITYNRTPLETVPAKLIGKRTYISGGGNNTSISTNYYMTFQLSDGTRTEFEVGSRDYALYVEGDAGMLTYHPLGGYRSFT